MSKQTYPLAWPIAQKRTPGHARRRSDFKVTQRGRAINDLQLEVKRLGGSELVISSNVRIRVDGLPFADERPLNGDPGVAVYFKRKGKPMVFACDHWYTVTENIWAIVKTIDALRGIERWGSTDMQEQAFTGFVALPAPEQWFEVLGVGPEAGPDTINNAWRRLASDNHPDKGGTDAAMARLNRARQQGLERFV